MSKRTLGLQMALAATIALDCNLSAQTFQTVDDFNLYPGLDCVAQAMGQDPFGNIYAAGYMSINAQYDSAAGIRKSSDGGATWNVIDLYSEGASPGHEYRAVTSDAAGNLYAAGQNLLRDWFVRHSGDGGATWATVDTLPGSGQVRGAATDAAGNVFVVGYASTNTGGSLVHRWVVRKGIGGAFWSTVDFFNPGSSASANGVLCHPAGVFVYGAGNVTVKKTTTSYGYVRRSQDGGATWTTVDTSAPVIPGGIGSDAAGNIYVVGENAGHWIVRKSTNGGTTWTTIDDFQTCVTAVISTKPYRTRTTCYTANANSFATDAFGNLFVAGYSDSPTGQRWIVRASVGGTGPWQTVDDFEYAPGKRAVALGMVADDTGHVFVGGWSGYTQGHWFVRRN